MDQISTRVRDRTCYKCGFYGSTSETNCPTCRASLFTRTATRIRGAMLLGLGAFLTAFMGYIAVWTGAAFGNTGPNGARFIGTGQDKLLIIGLFSLLIIFGLFAVITGGWQLAAGRRSKALSRATVLIGVMIGIGAGAIIYFTG